MSFYSGYRSIPWGVTLNDYTKIYQKIQFESYNAPEPSLQLREIDAYLMVAFPLLFEIDGMIRLVEYDEAMVLFLDDQFFGVAKEIDTELEDKIDQAISSRYGELKQNEEERINKAQTRVTHSNSRSEGAVIYSKIYENISEQAEKALPSKTQLGEKLGINKEKPTIRNIEKIYLLTYSVPLYQEAIQLVNDEIQKKRAKEAAQIDQAIDDVF